MPISNVFCLRVCFIFAFLCVGVHCIKNITIGVSLSRQASLNVIVEASNQFMNGMLLGQSWYAKQPNFVFPNGQEYRLDFLVKENFGDKTLMLEQYEEMALDSNIHFLIGPPSSAFACAARVITDPNKLMVQAFAAADECTVYSERTYALVTPSSSTLNSAFLQLKLAKARTYSYIQENSLSRKATCAGTISMAEENNIELRCNLTVPHLEPHMLNSSDPLLIKENIAAWRAAIDQISQCDQDVVVICAYYPSVFTMIDRAKEINYTPKQWLVASTDGAWDSYPNREFVSTSTQWLAQVAFPPDKYFGRPSDYSQAFQNMFGYIPASYEAIGTEAVLVFYDCLMRSQSIDPESVRFSMSRTDLSTFFGRLLFSGNNLPMREAIIYQFVTGAPNNRTVIAPARAQQTEMIYPIPTWDERVSNYGWFVESQDIAVAALFGVCMFVTLLLALFIAVYRNHPLFRAAQFRPSMVICLGAICCYTSVFTWMLYVTDASCASLPWILGTGFVLLFGLLLLKTWRVSTIFHSAHDFKRTTNPEAYLYLWLALLLVILYSILIPWTAVSPLHAEIRQPQPYRPAYDYWVCASDSTSNGFLIAVLTYAGCLLLAGAFFAFRIRNVQFDLFNDAKVIGFAIYNLLICCSVCLGLLASNVGGPTTQFWIRELIILFAPLLTLFIIYMPKIYTKFTHGDISLFQDSRQTIATSGSKPHSDSNITSASQRA